VAGKTVTLKIKYSDFKMQTRSKTVPNYVSKKQEILDIATDLLRQESFRESVRLLGLSLSNLNTEDKEEEPVEVQLEFKF
jgi:DNA polymerase-4